MKPVNELNTERDTVPCTYCKEPTYMLGTKLCDRCWELSTRIRHDHALAAAMLAENGYTVVVAPKPKGTKE